MNRAMFSNVNAGGSVQDSEDPISPSPLSPSLLLVAGLQYDGKEVVDLFVVTAAPDAAPAAAAASVGAG